ncbi:hypothetical protein [Planomicrobium sp. CPCC 101079]|uniref:hypothetical protein n=1 Tax=Planomicrobium sp. CPCC 101079 TaxID=2599618 RepID=UPI0011B5F64C|nr:hypothetical protein [Planomicrobium sp. CPCC 101079]TWT00150.1 hypothetical protein FQV28_18710 [Planomicrobium sp. CPCC 101079]
MERGIEKFKRLNDKQETRRLVELGNKQLSDMKTNLAGAKEEGYKIGIERAIKNMLKNKPDMPVESIAELLEVDISQVERLKNERTNLKEN